MCAKIKNVLIVGGSGKIGSAIALGMKSMGYKVFIVARNEQKLSETQKKLATDVNLWFLMLLGQIKK